MGESRTFSLLLGCLMEYLKANYLFESHSCLIEPSKIKREWMDRTVNKFAYRCLPLSIANQTSWDVLCPSSIKATWEGDISAAGVSVEYLDDYHFKYAGSEFGHGILTFHVDFIITSSQNTSLFVKGPANSFKKNVNALEAIVETHWLPFTFTFNWMFNEPGEVVFRKGEPMFSFFPINLDYVESFETDVDFIKNDPEFDKSYSEYTNSRQEHLDVGHTNGSDWQKYYMKGITPSNLAPSPNHKSKINLKRFTYEK